MPLRRDGQGIRVHLIGPVRKYTNYTILAAASQIESNTVRNCKDLIIFFLFIFNFNFLFIFIFNYLI